MINEIEASEASKRMIKILATLEPSTEIYKMVMAYMLAVLAGNLPEWNSERTSKFSVLILDYLESRDPCIYVQILDTLLQGMSEKKLFLAELNKQMELLGRAKVKTITIDSGVSQSESIPVVLALYNRKKNVKKAALYSLYQQWVEKNDINDGRDLRMITSMLIQYIEEKESEEVLIITFALIEHLLSKDMLADVLIKRLYSCLVNEFIPVYFPPCRQYSNEWFMKRVNLLLSLKHGDVFENMQSLIYIIWNLNESCKSLLNDFSFKDNLTEEGDLKIDRVSYNHALELLIFMIKSPKYSSLQSGKIWNFFELYFSQALLKVENDPFIGAKSLLDALNAKPSEINYELVKGICCIFVGKLPSLSNTDRTNKDRLKVHELMIQFWRINISLVPSIFETIIVKHLSCDVWSIVDYMLSLYHENSNYSSLRVECLLFVNRVLNHISDLILRTQLLAAHFTTFLSILADPEAEWRKASLNIIKYYDNYESFAKVLKKDKLKSSTILEFLINKRKIHQIKRGKLLDQLEEFIDDIGNCHTTEISSDMTYTSGNIILEKNNALFEYFMYGISNARTPNELNSLLTFIKTQKFTADQMHIFWNVLVTIEFKVGLPGKEHSYHYINSLIEILCNQNSKDGQIAENIHDSLLGVLDQYNKRDYNISEHYVIKVIRKLVNITSEYSLRNQSNADNFEKVFKQIGTITDVVQDCIKNPEAPTFYLKTMTIDLLKSVPGEYISTLFTRVSESLNTKLWNDIDTFKRILFVLDCWQSITLEFSNLSILLNLIQKLGDVISEIELQQSSDEDADFIEMLIVLINLAQNWLSETDVVSQDQIKNEIEQHIAKLVDIFNLQLEHLWNIYQEEAKIKEIENIVDPVQEFLMKDSLMTSAQKERQQSGVEEMKDEDKIQKDIILYQSLSHLLLLISNIQWKSEKINDNSINKIYTWLSSSMSSLHLLESDAQYSSQTLKTYIRQILILQVKIILNFIKTHLDISFPKDYAHNYW